MMVIVELCTLLEERERVSRLVGYDTIMLGVC